MLENFSQVKAGINVLMKNSGKKKKKNNFVIAEEKSKLVMKNREEIRLQIKNWLGKEIFENHIKGKKIERAITHKEDHKYNKIEGSPNLMPVRKHSSMTKIVIDSVPKETKSSDSHDSSSKKV
jgi:hypothetical protein